jgi:hypothetical protein
MTIDNPMIGGIEKETQRILIHTGGEIPVATQKSQ